MRKVYYVARTKGRRPLYAGLGENIGMGREIVNVTLDQAEKSDSPAGLMCGFLGGHYVGYDAVKVVETIRRIEEKVKWPKPDEVFDR